MSIIQKPDKSPLDPTGVITLPSMEVPSFRYLLAQERRVLKNILIRTPFALGDCICAEPAIRYAIKNFDGCSISVVTPFPELYQHLEVKKFYNSKNEKPNWDSYHVLECYYAAEALQSEFVQNFNMAIGDYIATCLFKGQLPVSDRNIVLRPDRLNQMPKRDVVIHAGKHWASKTFPKSWWDQIISELRARGITPVLIGASIDDGKRGYVDVDATGCEDLRDKLTIMQSVSLLQNAKVVLTNDSAPYHMAASGYAHIGVFSTVRHIDFIGHWRPALLPATPLRSSEYTNHWNHHITNLAKGQMWTNAEVNPLKNGSKYDVIDQETLRSWLPEPEFVADWTGEIVTINNALMNAFGKHEELNGSH